MNKEQAMKQLKNFIGVDPLTFSIKLSANEEWVAQCNEIDSIITCGKGLDIVQMENLMQDAILSAAGIPKEFSENMLKRVFSNEIVELKQSELDPNSTLSIFQSTYKFNNKNPNATLGKLQTY